MAKRLPENAFEYYASLGPKRSYELVAERFGVSKRTVVSRAVRDGWQRQVEDMESRAREESLKKAKESIGDLEDRHLKMLRAIQGKALETLKSMPLKTGMDAVRALDLSLSQERELLGHGAESGQGSATEDGDDAVDLGEEFPALKRWLEEAPRWQAEILPATGYWPESDARTNRHLLDLVTEIATWVDRHVRSGSVPRSSPFHVMVTWSFRLEHDPGVVEAMRGKIVELSDELERQRVRLGIERQDREKWETLGIERPGEPHGRCLEWREAFGIEGGVNDPITFVAMRIRAGERRPDPQPLPVRVAADPSLR